MSHHPFVILHRTCFWGLFDPICILLVQRRIVVLRSTIKSPARNPTDLAVWLRFCECRGRQGFEANAPDTIGGDPQGQWLRQACSDCLVVLAGAWIIRQTVTSTEVPGIQRETIKSSKPLFHGYTSAHVESHGCN